MKIIWVLIWMSCLVGSRVAHAQINVVPVDSLYRLGAVVEGNDTIGYVFLNNVDVVGKLPRRFVRLRREQQRASDDLARLRYRVRKAYPYAVAAAYILKDVDEELARLEGNKKERRKFINIVEAQLNKRFKGELEDFTINEGIVLVKLINRQTGKNCYSIIRELKGGFSAVIWQSVALLFENNLRREYDPQGRDETIEHLVRELEASRNIPRLGS